MLGMLKAIWKTKFCKYSVPYFVLFPILIFDIKIDGFVKSPISLTSQ